MTIALAEEPVPAPAGSSPEPAPRRDPRIDFFRGLALLVMALDHAEELSGKQILSYVTYAPIGISTAAEVFIFLSGFTLGLAYEKVYLQRGYFLLHTRCLARAWQLYVMHIVCLVLTVAALVGMPWLCGVDSESVPITKAIETSNGQLWRFVTLQAQPQYFDILPLYIVFLAFLPPFFILLNGSLAWGLGLSTAIYLAVQAAVALGHGNSLPFAGTMYYNPVAWQFLFVIGMALGIGKRLDTSPPRLASRWLWPALTLLAVVGFWYKFVRLNVLFGWFGDAGYTHGMSIPYDIPWIDKSTLGPLRLAHFLLATLVVAYLLPAGLTFWRSRLARSVLVCGQHALEVFVAGVVLNYAVAALMQATHGGRVQMATLGLATVAASVFVGFIVAWRKSEPWRAKS